MAEGEEGEEDEWHDPLLSSDRRRRREGGEGGTIRWAEGRGEGSTGVLTSGWSVVVVVSAVVCAAPTPAIRRACQTPPRDCDRVGSGFSRAIRAIRARLAFLACVARFTRASRPLARSGSN